MDKSIAYKQYINDISKVLDIQPPEMRTVPAAELLTPTQIAAYTDGSILFRDDMELSSDVFLALSHELRHAWQIANGVDLEAYQTSREMGLEAHNLQPLEMDANAFAIVAMSVFLGIAPQFQNLPKSVCHAINDRANAIRADIETRIARANL